MDKLTLIGDFETTVYEGQTSTEVWASAIVQLYTENVLIFHSIDETWDYLLSLDTDIDIYYHNLKFDGSFWLDFFIRKLKMSQAFEQFKENSAEGRFLKEREMQDNTVAYVISEMGQWYTIRVKIHGHMITFKDSLKILPFSVDRIGKSFKTKHKKLSMTYDGYRYAGCEITDKEKEYIANDVLVVKEAVEIMFEEGHNKLTIGACCLSEYKRIFGTIDYKQMFPDLSKMRIDPLAHGVDNVDTWIRKSYKGGWCYVVPSKVGKIKTNGVTADVNSLYPSMMHSESGNSYPYGNPTFWVGNHIPPEADRDNTYFFVRIRTRFYIKDDMLPFIQIKGSTLYTPTLALETSDIYDKHTDKYYRYWRDENGVEHDSRVELTLTQTDYYLMLKHYHLVDCEIIDGCWFFCTKGLFDGYIDKYKQIKMTSKGARRELAKLFLNNLYGKFASSTNSSFKVAFVKDNHLSFYPVEAHEKKAGYIAIGSAITSYSRNFTITAAQNNYYGKDKRGFIYADTDSIHCDLKPYQLKGIRVDDVNFCCWKLEALWDKAIFTRQKTYIEHVTHENLEPIEEPYNNIKCAGMPQKCKDLFEKSMQGIKEGEDISMYNEEEQEFIKTKRTFEDFKVGLKVPSKLLPKRIDGGILLVNTTYEMR